MNTRNNKRHLKMRESVKRFGLAIALGAMTSLSTPAFAQDADSASILIYDASGSMWGQLEGGVSKVEVAREVIGDFFSSRDNSQPLGVIAYGHNRRGDCADIEVIANVGINEPAGLTSSLNRLNPRGMTPITDSLSLAASMIPSTAESADIILVTDGLETCDADPCALAAQLAQEGIAIRAHVVGFGLTTEEAEAMSCVADATGGLLLTPQSGQELADALNQIAEVEPAPAPEPQLQPVAEAFFDIGPKAEAGHDYTISFEGMARNVDYAGFTRRGEGQPDVSPSYGVLGGADVGNNPFTRRAPLEPGEYDLILAVTGQGIIARQPIEVVPPANGFDAIGSVEPDMRFEFGWRGPNQVGQRLVIARPGAAPDDYFPSWGYPYNNRQTQRMGLTAPAEPGIYELRYISGNSQEILFSREFGVGVPFEDTDATNTADLAAQAAAATQAAPGQDAMPMVLASFRTPDNFPQIPLWWDAIPLDPDMSPEAYAPISEFVVWENEFEPGRYRVSAMGPGETEFSAEVEIYPGQDNNFVIPVVGGGDQDAAADTLTGPWELYGVPPWEVDAGLDLLLSFDLDQPSEESAIGGSWTATAMLGGAQVEGRTGQIQSGSINADDLVELRFEVGDPIPEPFSMMVRPDGIGFSGGLSAGPMGISVVLWPTGYELPALDQLRAGLHGPDPRAGEAASAPTLPVQTQSGLVPVRLLTAFEIGGKRVQWSAIRTDTPVSDVAFAFDELEHMALVELAPGTYAVEGVNAEEGIFLADIITVTAGGENSFEIPVAGGADGSEVAEAGYGEDVGAVCIDTPGGCFVEHAPSGISLTLPNNWTMAEPYFYETAGGARSDVPTTIFTSQEFGELVTVTLNPHQWLDSNGPCQPIGESQLCNFSGQGLHANIGFELIHASIVVTPLNADGSAGGATSAGDNTLDDPMLGEMLNIFTNALGGERATQTGAPLPGAPADKIRIVLRPSEQFGSGCFINANVNNPSGESFTLLAPINASANGEMVRPVMESDEPLMFDIPAYSENGGTLVPTMLMAPCGALVVDVGPVQCRMGVGDGGPVGACPMPIEVIAEPGMAQARLVGN